MWGAATHKQKPAAERETTQQHTKVTHQRPKTNNQHKAQSHDEGGNSIDERTDTAASRNRCCGPATGTPTPPHPLPREPEFAAV